MYASAERPAVVLLHGFGDTGDMWAPLAAVLVEDHTVIVPDLRGMGSSGHPDTGYTKKNQAVDIAGVMDALKVQKADLAQDAKDNQALLGQVGKLRMPVLAVGAEKSFGHAQAQDLSFVASNVTTAIVPNSGHWIMEENPQATIRLVMDFLGK
jgi:pimeloyl-ACP methyl ester carboxylesterase